MSFRANKVRERLKTALTEARNNQPTKTENGIFTEKRPAVRVKCDFEVTFKTEDLTSLSGRVTEISRTGLRLQTNNALRFNANIVIVFGKEFPAPKLAMNGQVVRVSSQDGQPLEYGVKITADASAKATLATAVLQINMAVKLVDRTRHY